MAKQIRFVMMQDERHKAVPDRLLVPLTGLGDIPTEAELFGLGLGEKPRCGIDLAFFS